MLPTIGRRCDFPGMHCRLSMLKVEWERQARAERARTGRCSASIPIAANKVRPFVSVFVELFQRVNFGSKETLQSFTTFFAFPDKLPLRGRIIAAYTLRR